MALYEITSDELKKIEQTTFGESGIYERGDMQRLLRRQIDVILPDILIVGEEFGDWEESRRRIDLLGIDRGAKLVVIELKRTEDGGHMELQALRYAAMVSTMTFENIVGIYERFLRTTGENTVDPRSSILEFLSWEEPDEELFAQDVRILLVSSNFSKELTTAVIWLNNRAIDITCVRVIPYKDEGRILLDVQQIIPLPEAADYQIRIREKDQIVRQNRTAKDNNLAPRFWETFLESGSGLIPFEKKLQPGSNRQFMIAPSDVKGFSFVYQIAQKRHRVELNINVGEKEKNQQIFDQLFGQKERIGAAFGDSLSWERRDELSSPGCGILYRGDGGYGLAESEWPRLQERFRDAIIRFEKALSPAIQNLPE